MDSREQAIEAQKDGKTIQNECKSTKEIKQPKTKDENTKRIKIYMCPECHMQLSSYSQLHKHMAKKHPENTLLHCTKCSEIFSDVSELKSHKCMMDACACSFPGCSNTLSATVCFHKHQKKQETEFRCNICLKRFQTNKQLKNHFRSHSSERNFQCSQCGKMFKLKAHLQTHFMNVHTGLRPFKCDVCGKTFKNAFERNIHRRKHTGYKPSMCEVCGERFISTGILNRHKKNHHPNNALGKPTCKICKKQFSGQLTLLNHMDQHTSSGQYSCHHPGCSRKFSNKRGLYAHFRVYHKRRDDAKFRCQICKKLFITPSKLEEHMRNHSGLKPFKCPVENCSKSLGTRTGLERHLQIHKGDKPFQCEECGRRFTFISHYNTHKRSHLFRQFHQCMKCEKAFAQISQAKKHVLIKHFGMQWHKNIFRSLDMNIMKEINSCIEKVIQPAHPIKLEMTQHDENEVQEQHIQNPRDTIDRNPSSNLEDMETGENLLEEEINLRKNCSLMTQRSENLLEEHLNETTVKSENLLEEHLRLEIERLEGLNAKSEDISLLEKQVMSSFETAASDSSIYIVDPDVLVSNEEQKNTSSIDASTAKILTEPMQVIQPSPNKAIAHTADLSCSVSNQHLGHQSLNAWPPPPKSGVKNQEVQPLKSNSDPSLHLPRVAQTLKNSLEVQPILAKDKSNKLPTIQIESSVCRPVKMVSILKPISTFKSASVIEQPQSTNKFVFGQSFKKNFDPNRPISIRSVLTEPLQSKCMPKQSLLSKSGEVSSGRDHLVKNDLNKTPDSRINSLSIQSIKVAPLVRSQVVCGGSSTETKVLLRRPSKTNPLEDQKIEFQYRPQCDQDKYLQIRECSTVKVEAVPLREITPENEICQNNAAIIESGITPEQPEIKSVKSNQMTPDSVENVKDKHVENHCTEPPTIVVKEESIDFVDEIDHIGLLQPEEEYDVPMYTESVVISDTLSEDIYAKDDTEIPLNSSEVGVKSPEVFLEEDTQNYPEIFGSTEIEEIQSLPESAEPDLETREEKITEESLLQSHYIKERIHIHHPTIGTIKVSKLRPISNKEEEAAPEKDPEGSEEMKQEEVIMISVGDTGDGENDQVENMDITKIKIKNDQEFMSVLDMMNVPEEEINKLRRRTIKGVRYTPGSFLCQDCGKFFKNERSLKKHKALHAEYNNLTCSKCGESFQDKASFSLHKRTKHVVKDKKCEVCGRCYQYANELHKHMQIHVNENCFMCPTCGECFKTRLGLQGHRISQHKVAVETSRRQVYVCEVCGNLLRSKPAYDDHLNIHKENPIQYQCQECKKTFLTLKSYKAHQRLHKVNKRFQCDYCDKSFMFQAKLNEHMTKHTGIKQYLCTFPGCGARLGTRTGLDRHLFIHSGVKNFFCKLCGKTFSFLGHLNAHLATHSSEKPFRCEDCGKYFSRSAGLKRHLAYKDRCRKTDVVEHDALATQGLVELCSQ